MSNFADSKEGHYERMWRDECEAGATVRKERDAAIADAKRWRQIATYIANVYAATAEHGLMIKATSASQRVEYAATCRKILGLFIGTDYVPNVAYYQNEKNDFVRERLQRVFNQQPKK